jgi:hypothetical protein
MKTIDSKTGASVAKHCLLIFATAYGIVHSASLVKPTLDAAASVRSKTERIYCAATERLAEYKQGIALVRELIGSEGPPSRAVRSPKPSEHSRSSVSKRLPDCRIAIQSHWACSLRPRIDGSPSTRSVTPN